ILIPRMTAAQRTAIPCPATGLMVYQNDGDTGFWYYDGTNWISISEIRDLVFERNGTTIRQKEYYDTDDFIIGNDSLPQNGVAITNKILFFNKSKAAFRSGQLSNSKNWSPDSIGLASFAFNITTKAKGKYSTAWGQGTTASGPKSTAFGYQTKAISNQSTAWGNLSEASGTESTAWGYNSYASFFATTAWGYYTEASLDLSTAWGDYSKASGLSSTAWGAFTEASGTESTAWGDNSVASGEKATAWGQGTTASGTRSTAFGYQSQATNNQSTAWGKNTLASGIKSTAWGENTTASGENSTSWGGWTKAYGKYSMVGGYKTKAPSAFEIVLGANNTNYTAIDTFVWNGNDRLFTIGNGPSTTNKRNALTILKKGTIGIGSVTNPTYALELPQNSSLAKGHGRAYAWDTYSDSRVKFLQKPINYGLDELMKLVPKSYIHHSSTFEDGVLSISDEGEHTIGLIAQEVYKIIPEAVQKPEDESKDLWSMDYEKLIPVLIKGMQQQQETIEDLKEENKTLKQQLQNVMERLDVLEKK
ncbi:MAG TPA: hypothetical protein ENK91_03150, partial [Bacteroidetes bacterium]|nr:hypothetical protein [Bacteroidota bacterium]